MVLYCRASNDLARKLLLETQVRSRGVLQVAGCRLISVLHSPGLRFDYPD